VTLQ
jgi:hypothetical protein